MSSFCLRRWLALVLCGLLTAPTAAESGNPQATRPTRVVAGLPSATRLLEDLEWIVAKLGEDQQTWDDTLLPAAEVFLIGVDMELPIGTDLVFDREGGQRKQFQIPIDDLQVFREENLEPIDIQSRRRAPDYYELNSAALGFKGWMRIVEDYASISTKEADVPKGMPSPQKALDELFGESGYDAAVTARNDSEGIADRKESFKEFRENRIAGLTRRPTETPEAFALRKRLAQHQSQRIERLFVEGEKVTAGWITDVAKGEARGELLLSALAGTELAKVLAKFGAAPSYFAAVPTTEDYLVHGRMNIPIDQTLQTQADEFYELVGPVWKQRIDGDKELTDVQKQARRQIADLGLQMLHEGRLLQAIDGCIEIAPAAGGTNILIAGIRTADGTKAIDILKLIPDALGDLALELNVETANEVAIHRLKPTGKVPATLEAFYGKDQEVFVGTHKDAVWIAAGAGSLEKLKAMIGLVNGEAGEATGDVFVGKVRLGPMLKHLDELAVEAGFNPKAFLGVPETPPAAETDEEGAPRRRPGAALAGFDWRGVALPVLQGADDDRFILHVRREEESGVIRADTFVERGVLKAAGKVIATIAAEKLGG